MTESRKPIIYRLVIITALLLAVYGITLNHGFVWDDTDVIAANQQLGSLGNILSFFTSENNVDASQGYYRPVTYVSFLIDRTIWGVNPLGFKITNLLLHCAVALSFYLVMNELFTDERYAFIASLIFSMHPIANETVNFLAGGRNTLLCALFALLSLFFHIRRKFLAAITCFTLAIFSKEFALLMPVLFLFRDRYLANEKRPFKTYLSYAVTTIGYLTIRSHVVAAPNFLHQLKIENLLFLMPQLVFNYLTNMLLPVRLKTMYEIKTADQLLEIMPFLVILLLIIMTVGYFRKVKKLVFAATWFLLFLLPVSGILRLGITTMADRYAYFSAMGFAMALAYCINLANRKAVILLMAILCGWYVLIDFQRNSYWKDEFSLFNQMVNDAPHQAIGFQNLGLAYYERGDIVTATDYLSTALTKEATNAKMLAGSAAIFWQAKQFDKAKLALNLAGEKLLADHDLMMAEQRFKQALAIDPAFVPALIDMGSLCAEKSDYKAALDYFSRASALDPSNPSVHYNLSKVYESLGKMAEASEEMNKFRGLDERIK